MSQDMSSLQLPIDPLRSHPMNASTVRRTGSLAQSPASGLLVFGDNSIQEAVCAPVKPGPMPRRSSSFMFGSHPRHEGTECSNSSHRVQGSVSTILNFSDPGAIHRRTTSSFKAVLRKIFSRKQNSQATNSANLLSTLRPPLPPAQNSLPERDSFRILQQSQSAEAEHMRQGHHTPRTRSQPLFFEQNLTAGQNAHKPPRRRRATLPSLVFSDDDMRTIFATIPQNQPHTEMPGNCIQSQKLDNDEMLHRSMGRNEIRSRSTDDFVTAGRDQCILPNSDRANVDLMQSQVRSDSISARSPPPVIMASDPERGIVTDVKGGPAVSVFTVPESGPEIARYDVGQLLGTMHHGDNDSLEQRLATLEVKLIDLEFAIVRLQTHGNDASSTNKALKATRPKRAPSSPPDLARRYNRNKTSRSFSSLRNETSSFECDYYTVRDERHESSSTIRAGTFQLHGMAECPSSSSLTDQNTVPIEQYRTLVTLLKREQKAHRNLEKEVFALQKAVRRLHRAAVVDPIGAGILYPTRNPDPQDAFRFREALDALHSVSPARVEEPNGGFDSDSGVESPDFQTVIRTGGPKKEPNARFEITEMI